MVQAAPEVIDADGHLIESTEELAPYLEPSIREAVFGPRRRHIFGSLDGIHGGGGQRSETLGTVQPDRKERVNASEYRMGSGDDWGVFLEKAGVKHAVLYPTDGLAIGNWRSVEYVTSICRSYNDWVADAYQKKNAHLNPVALIPMQDPAQAVLELRRAVKELGLIGAMLPATGLPLHLGHEYYWPVYEEAANLDCILGIHGGSNNGMGINTFSNFVASHILHFPVPNMYAFTSFVYDGVFDKWPQLRWMFLEGGSAWVALILDRAERDASYFGAPRTSIPKHLASGRILIGLEGEDQSLPYMIPRVGVECFAYSSDYPHEVDAESAKHEIEEGLERPELTQTQKAAILGGNTRRFLRL